MRPKRPRVFHSPKSGGGKPSGRPRGVKKDWRVMTLLKQEINIAQSQTTVAQVCHLKDGRIFAIGPDPIDNKLQVFRSSASGWARVPKKDIPTILGELGRANSKLQL
tara:strand:+ start:1107 stop:1427 length:321 start_codon:yes stop_codon:yes gene_type:complete